MKYIPHDYQSFAEEHIRTHETAALFLDMGLGKTVITLTAIERLMYQSFEVRKVLVIAPLRVAAYTWPAEIRKWDHLEGLRCSVAVGTAQERLSALRRKADIYLINRENVPWLVEKSGVPFDFDMLVIDELSSFKSWQSKRFRALLKERPLVSRVVGLTGTPTGNGLMDLFAEYRILDLGQRLGRFIGRYRDAYFVPDKRNGQQVFSWKPRPGAEAEIYRRIGDITVSMKSMDHLKMPERVMNTVDVYMDERERRLYERMKEELVLNVLQQPGTDAAAQRVLTVDAKNAASLCGKLSQLANGAVYAEDGLAVKIHDRKLDALEDLIEASAGHPLLVAYWYRHDLERIRERFPSVRTLKTPQDIQDWNGGKIPLAAIHPASAGHGLNLQQGGNTLVWFGLTWSLELYQQTNARLWRQGQAAKTVVIHHIVTKDTVDEQILSALKRKDRTQESLIAAVKAQIQKGGDAA